MRKPTKAQLDEWYAKTGLRDIEYADGSLLGISVQEVERAPSPEELSAAQEYHSRVAEFLHARDWTGDERGHVVWTGYVDNLAMRDISKASGIPLTTVHRCVERLRRACTAWWEATRAAREKPKPEMGRPRKENARRYRIEIWLSREEHRAVSSAAFRVGEHRPHARKAWIRATLLAASHVETNRLPHRSLLSGTRN